LHTSFYSNECSIITEHGLPRAPDAQGERFGCGAAADGWTDDVGGFSRLVRLTAD
jgi:hypothetical protein